MVDVALFCFREIGFMNFTKLFRQFLKLRFDQF